MKNQDLNIDKEYKYGFTTDIESIRAPKGLNEDTIKFTIEALADVWENPEAIEGINAFFEKKKPSWIMEN